MPSLGRVSITHPDPLDCTNWNALKNRIWNLTCMRVYGARNTFPSARSVISYARDVIDRLSIGPRSFVAVFVSEALSAANLTVDIAYKTYTYTLTQKSCVSWEPFHWYLLGQDVHQSGAIMGPWGFDTRSSVIYSVGFIFNLDSNSFYNRCWIFCKNERWI